MTGDPLRKCPTCLSPVEPGELGFRDYRFLGQALPGKVAPMDFDMVLERHGHVLIVELKPKGVAVGKGQQITYKAMANKEDVEVWLVQGDQDDSAVVIQEMNKHGVWTNKRSVKPDVFLQLIAEWFEQW